MFSGKDWVDNVTIPGWYACTDLNNKNKALPIEVPNLEQTFIMGTNNTEVQDDKKRNGGKNDITKDDLPEHDHAIEHDHPVASSFLQSANHTHTFSGTTSSDTHRHELRNSNAGGSNEDICPFGDRGGAIAGASVYTMSDTHNHSYSGTTSNPTTNHYHDVDLPNFTGTSGSTGNGKGAGSESVMENRPKYYTVIYIIKAQ